MYLLYSIRLFVYSQHYNWKIAETVNISEYAIVEHKLQPDAIIVIFVGSIESLWRPL